MHNWNSHGRLLQGKTEVAHLPAELNTGMTETAKWMHNIHHMRSDIFVRDHEHGTNPQTIGRSETLR